MGTFKDEAAVWAWLTAHNVDATLWGKGQAKQVNDLWHELKNQESVLQDDPPLRSVEVVQVIVRQNDMYLVEAAQKFGNGRMRERNQPPAEKMKAGECAAEAAHRCLQEELGISPDALTLLLNTYRFVEYEADSRSYPGLLTRYTIHILEAEVSGLPQEEFWRKNSSFADDDPVCCHLWAWKDVPVPFSGQLDNHL